MQTRCKLNINLPSSLLLGTLYRLAHVVLAAAATADARAELLTTHLRAVMLQCTECSHDAALTVPSCGKNGRPPSPRPDECPHVLPPVPPPCASRPLRRRYCRSARRAVNIPPACGNTAVQAQRGPHLALLPARRPESASASVSSSSSSSRRPDCVVRGTSAPPPLPRLKRAPRCQRRT
jgi:hypothetical protein